MSGIIANLPVSASQIVLPAVLAATAFFAYQIYTALYTTGDYAGLGLPLVGEPAGKKYFSIRTRMRYYNDASNLYKEAYHKYSKFGKACLVPGYGSRADLVMPETSVEWAIAQPDDVLSVSQAFLQANHSSYSLGHSRYWGDPWQFSLVKTQLNNILNTLIPAVEDELNYAVVKHFGEDTENWKELDLEHTVRRIVCQTTSRFNVGVPLCRNDDYMEKTLEISDGIMITAIAGNIFPGILLPIVGRLFSMHTHWNLKKLREYTAPTIIERVKILNKPNEEQPQDQLQLLLRFAQKKRPEELKDINIMSTRLSTANFVSMHQTSSTLTTMLLNIIGSDNKYETIDALRKEANMAQADGAPGWTKEKFAKMVKYDSVARETMRCTFPFGTRGLLRRVQKDGVVTNEGVPLKKGTIVSFLAAAAQMDPSKYDNAEEYDPFRFSRKIELESAQGREAEIGADGKPVVPDTFVATSPVYLPFGHGRHACPGRFLVDYELKMIVAHMLKYYDLRFPDEYNGVRPPMKHVAELNMPPAGAKIFVKKRVTPA